MLQWINTQRSYCPFSLLKRFSYPCRYLDMVHCFSMAIPQLIMACNNVISLIYARWCHLWQNFRQAWLFNNILYIKYFVYKI